MVTTLLLALLGCPTDAPEGTTDVVAAPGMTDGVLPPPTGEAAGQGQGGTEPKLEVVAGEGVKLSGTATYDGEATAPIRLDVLKQGEGNFQRVHTMTLEKFGAFEVELPKNFGTVQIAVLVDSGGPAKPMAITTPIIVGDQPIADLVLVLSHLDASAGPGTPPADGSAPPLGAPPADGALPPPPPGSPPADGALLPPPSGAAPPAGTPPVAPAGAPPG